MEPLPLTLVNSSQEKSWVRWRVRWRDDDGNAHEFLWDKPGAISSAELQRLRSHIGAPRSPEQIRQVTASSPLSEDWEVRVDLRRGDGGVVLDRLEVLPGAVGASTPLGSGVLRELGLDWLRAAIERGLRDGHVRAVLPGWYDDLVARPRPGRAGRHDIEYAHWAARYVRAVEEDARAPVKYLVDRFAGVEYVSEQSLRAILHKARQRELLTAAPPGRAGGDLTDKARDLLREAGVDEEGL